MANIWFPVPPVPKVAGKKGEIVVELGVLLKRSEFDVSAGKKSWLR